MNKKILNIVFYKDKSLKGTKIFYEDGTIEETSYEIGKRYINKIIEDENIQTQEEYEELVNTKKIFVLSKNELDERINEFKAPINTDSIIDQLMDDLNKQEVIEEDHSKKENEDFYKALGIKEDKQSEEERQKEIKEEEEVQEIVEEVNNTNNEEDIDNDIEQEQHLKANPLFAEVFKLDDTPAEKYDDHESVIVNKYVNYNNFKCNTTKPTEQPAILEGVSIEEENSNSFPKPSIDEPKNQGNSKRSLLNKTKKGIIALATAGVMFVTWSLFPNETVALTKDSKVGSMLKNKTKTEQQMEESYDNLLNQENGKTQKSVMKTMRKALKAFNIKFANKYKQKVKVDNKKITVKPALNWDEMISLQMSYNDYSANQIREIFNGAEMDSIDMENAYKNATLQLMGAYVIEDKGSFVDISTFVHSEEGISFVTKYQTMLEDAKNAKGKDKIKKVEVFYKELYKDFPITDEVRTEGISHADNRTIESYKLAVAPMVGAAEMMFQNLEVDHTLTDKAIDYFNDLGLCNLAQDTFDKIETITLSNPTNEDYPLYSDYKKALVKALKSEKAYVIDDQHRDLSLLDKFQERVNGHFKYIDGYFDTETFFTTVTYTTKKKWKVTTYSYKYDKEVIKTSDRDKAVEYAGEDAVKDAEDEVNKQIDEENKAEKEKAEEEAKKNQDEMQKDADKDAKEKEEQVKKDDQDLDKKIDEANEKIDNNKTVNEHDFDDHNVDFDDNHSDSNGNLDDSVKDVTKDGSDVKTPSDLPDPNETGAKFESKSSSNEQKVNAYVEKMASKTNDDDEDQKVLTK